MFIVGTIMITYSIIQKSQLEGAKRIDAEYFQPEYLELIENIKARKFSTVEDYGCKVVSGPFGSSLKSDAYLEEGIPFIRITDLQGFFIREDNLVYISKEDNSRLKQSQLQPFDLVSSKVGNTIGIVSAIPDELGNSNISENNIGIKFTDSKLDLGYKLFLLTLLNCRIGNLQIKRGISGNAQPKLNISDISQLLVPKPENALLNLIKDLIIEAQKNLSFAKALYQQAEDLLLEELGLKDFQVEEDLSFVVNLLDVRSANRVDSDYFQPKYEKLLKRIKQKDGRVLTNVIKNVTAKFDPFRKPDETFNYVELANINSSIGIIDGYSEVLGKEAPSRAKRLLKNGDVIVSSVEGSLEKVALVNDQEGYLASTGFFQFRSEEILPEVLLVLAKSIVMQCQFKKHCAGTILTAVPGESLQKMFIPAISKPTQEKIAELVRKAHEARKKSKELLEEAKRRVEEMIEKGGGN